MKRKVGKEPEGGSKNLNCSSSYSLPQVHGKKVGNDNSWASMFPKQQDVSAFNKARELKRLRQHTTQSQKRKEMELDGATQTCVPVRKGHT
jgi:hypothetical protein